MFNLMFDNLYNRARHLPPDERSSIVIGVLFVFVNLLLDSLFFVVFTLTDIRVMATFNVISLFIGLINMYIFICTKFKNLGLTLMIFDTCFYICFCSFLLGYDKNSIVLLPLMVLVTFSFFAKQPKFLAVNLGAIFITYAFNLHVKFFVDSMYQDVTSYVDFVNNMFAISGTIWFIFVSSKIETFVKSYTDKKIENLSKEANVDYLTGLKNRRFVEKFFDNRIIQPNTYIALADIDFFKKVNDSYGHDCGDFILKELSRILTKSFSTDDIICRWGGEEFLLYIKEDSTTNIDKKLNDFREEIEKNEFIYNGNSIHITITFGYTEINSEDTIKRNIKNADIALYYGKGTGRNKVVYFKDVLKNRSES